jgi:hypothetical protein
MNDHSEKWDISQEGKLGTYNDPNVCIINTDVAATINQI